MKKSIKMWAIAFAIAAPVAGLLIVGAIALGDWLPHQTWFANLIL